MPCHKIQPLQLCLAVCLLIIQLYHAHVIWYSLCNIFFQSKKQTVFVSELTYPVGVAVDWLGDALYWADSKAGTVEVILLQSPHYRRVLYWANLADINDIAVLPTQG